MNDFVNKIKTKDGVEYDMQDARLAVTAADAGKVVSVDAEGNLTLVDAPSGGTKLYSHWITYDSEGIGSRSIIVISTQAEAIDNTVTSAFAQKCPFIFKLSTNDDVYLITIGGGGPNCAVIATHLYDSTKNFIELLTGATNLQDTVTEL